MIDGVRPLNGSQIHRVVNYRNRAEELRTIAEDMLHASEQETLRRIATTYDQLADDVAATIEVFA